MPGPDRRRPRRLRCEACLDVLTLRHAWDTARCSCGALTVRGRPTKPVVHWVSHPGGGWTEVDDGLGPDPVPSPPGVTPRRRLGFVGSASVGHPRGSV